MRKRLNQGKRKMGKFNNKISAEFHPPRKWILERALSYKNEDIDVEALKLIGVKCPAHRISVKKGFVTDLASTPKIMWNIIAPWDIARAAIIHDFLYKRIRQYRADRNSGLGTENKETEFDELLNTYNGIVRTAKKAADDVFLMGMKDADPSVSTWKIYSAYYAVRMFGRWSIIPNEENV